MWQSELSELRSDISVYTRARHQHERSQADINISQGSVTTLIRRGGISDLQIVANLPLNLQVK